jgi:hypothetical protein
MSTKSTIWYGVDDKGKEVHFYWELAEREPGKAAPIYLEVTARNREVAMRLPENVAKEVRDVLEDPTRSLNLEVI